MKQLDKTRISKNSLYIVPNLEKVSGGPNTRINLFRKIFRAKGGVIFYQKNKLKTILKKTDMVYVESATNRISLIDVLSLAFLRMRSKRRIVFIRDIYIELFPEEYQNFRSKITFIFNKWSNFYLTLFANKLVFPTQEMGDVFFKKNPYFPKRAYTDLPPGTFNITKDKNLPDFSNKLGILYLGGTRYINAGFENFIKFAQAYRDVYNFYILSGDNDISEKINTTKVIITKVGRDEIPHFIEENNIAYAFHTRPRNVYDDLTYPIKVFDFLSFQLPFFTEKHNPIVKLLGNDYPLYASYEELDEIHKKIKNINVINYEALIDKLKIVAENNTYEKRYQKILEQ